MSGAPYGYRYMRKTDEAPAAYVRRVYEMYNGTGLSIGEVTRRINTEGIPTRKVSARWERATVWRCCATPPIAVSRVSARARFFFSTRVIRPLRRRGVTTPSMTQAQRRRGKSGSRSPCSSVSERASPVPRSFSGDKYDLDGHYRAQCRAGLSSCQKCGYAFSDARRARAHARFTTISALAPIAERNWAALYVTPPSRRQDSRAADPSWASDRLLYRVALSAADHSFDRLHQESLSDETALSHIGPPSFRQLSEPMHLYSESCVRSCASSIARRRSHTSDS